MEKLKEEIDRFVELLKYIEFEKITGIQKIETRCSSFSIDIIDKDEAEAVFKSMKSSAIIMLYNLLEYSIRTAMNEYYDRINERELSYSETTLELKKLWLKNKLKNMNKNSEFKVVFDIIEDILDEEHKVFFDFENVFSLSGNADIKEIKSILKMHSIRYDERELGQYGIKLLTIKNMRNKLAHGNVSFEENGKILSVTDIVNYKEATYSSIEYFKTIINN